VVFRLMRGDRAVVHAFEVLLQPVEQHQVHLDQLRHVRAQQVRSRAYVGARFLLRALMREEGDAGEDEERQQRAADQGEIEVGPAALVDGRGHRLADPEWYRARARDGG